MADSPMIALNFPGRHLLGNTKRCVLAGDVGGTKANLAIFEATADQITLIKTSSYHSGQYPSVIRIIQQFFRENPGYKPDRICLGVAGPVFEGHAEITNLPWVIDKKEIAAASGVQQISLINDLEATAYGLAGMEEKDFLVLHPGEPGIQGNMAVLAPGTGLGEAGLFWDGHVHHPFATEGGHSDLSCRSAEDMELHDFLLQKYKVVSWESAIGGPAIHDIYNFLCQVKKRPANAAVTDAFMHDDPSAVISEAAVAGTDPVCVEVMKLFVLYLARESCNLILKMKAIGGLFLAGGIPPKILPLLKQPDFYNNLLDCDRMQDLVKKVPVKLLLNDKAPMIGAGWYGAYFKS
ncbi:MAG: glucokinase [Bacteroidota bacterium]|nr:glucokinase [Bacteroidota bacterium]MDP4211882.1 glucokinase [Bacteroidota bacterium]MDP4248529.1 glucokinase [Bacteroidota bacterium]